MSARATYTGRCERRDGWWAVQVPEVPGVVTVARRLDQVEASARDAVARLLHVPKRSFDVRVEVNLPPEWAERVERAQKLRQEADALQREASTAAADALEALIGQGRLSVRDAGHVLGLSFQRVAQLRPQRSRTAGAPADGPSAGPDD